MSPGTRGHATEGIQQRWRTPETAAVDPALRPHGSWFGVRSPPVTSRGPMLVVDGTRWFALACAVWRTSGDAPGSENVAELIEFDRGETRGDEIW